MRGFDNRQVDGAVYFNSTGPIHLPAFTRLERRGGIVKGGVAIEIDLIGEYKTPGVEQLSAWLVQVKNTEKPISEDAVQSFLTQTAALQEQQPYAAITRWYFSKSGYTEGATQVLQQAGVLYSTLAQFNTLARLFDFFGLPR